MLTLSILNICLLVLVLAASVFLIFRFFKKDNNPEKQNSLDEMKTQIQSQMQTTTESLRGDLRHLQNQFGEHMRHQSDILQKTNTHLNERMDKAAQVIGDVQRELGKMSTVAKSLDDLQNILKAPKLRGGFGELFLNDLLGQILPTEHFSVQHRFKDGEIVDAVIYLGDKLVPIDSKFPLENFQKIVDNKNDDIPKNLRRQFINDVKKHIQAVEKYIRTDEGTYDFALMYIPAENIYYEVAVKEDLAGEGREIFNYALKRKVIPVSPNTLYAYLMTIIVGLKGMQVEKHAEAMLSKMARVAKDFGNFYKVYSKLGTHLENARKSYEDGDKRLSKVDGKLQEFGVAEEVGLLNEPGAVEVESELPGELQ